MAQVFTAQSAVLVFTERGRLYRAASSVTAERITEDRTWVSAAGDTLTARAGDWMVSDGSDSWSVAGGIFERTYENLGGDRYRKTATVVAATMDEPFSVETLEGIAHGEAGDFLVANPGGEVWPVRAALFSTRYTPA